MDRLACHFHGFDSLAKIFSAIDCGLRHFDAALEGLGGCPFAPDSPGNSDLYSLIEALHRSDFPTGLDLEKIKLAAELLRREL